MELKANKVQLKGIFDKCTSLYKETSFNLQSIQNKVNYNLKTFYLQNTH